MQLGNWNEAQELIEAASQSAPADPRVVDVLSQLALSLQDGPLLDRCEAQLRKIEGQFGPHWQASRIDRVLSRSIDQEAEQATAAVEEAADLADSLQKSYPQSPQTRIALGHVAARQGRLWCAVANYEEAWEMDLPRISLAVDLVGLLNELGQTGRAQRYVQEVRRYLAASQQVIDPMLLRLPSESAEEAIRFAEAAVRQNPHAESALRLGRTLVLAAMSHPREQADYLTRAENAFAQAVKWEPENTRAWAAYFRFLVAVKSDPVASQRVLFELAEREEISPLNRFFALAQLNESIGNLSRADELFHQVVEMLDEQQTPSEQLVVLQRSAQYFSRRDPTAAELCCRRALDIDPEATGAAQILIDLLLAQGTVDAIAEAERWFEVAKADLPSGDQLNRLLAEIRIQAAKLDQDGGQEQQAQAVSLLQGIVHKTREDALQLAELYLLQKKYSSALNELQIVTSQLPVEIDPLLQFLRNCDHQLQADVRLRHWAEQMFEMLEEQPDSMLDVLTLRLESGRRREAPVFCRINRTSWHAGSRPLYTG